MWNRWKLLLSTISTVVLASYFLLWYALSGLSKEQQGKQRGNTETISTTPPDRAGVFWSAARRSALGCLGRPAAWPERFLSYQQIGGGPAVLRQCHRLFSLCAL